MAHKRGTEPETLTNMGSFSSPSLNSSRSCSQTSIVFPKLPHVENPEAASGDEKPGLYRVSPKNDWYKPVEPTHYGMLSRQASLTIDGPLQAKSVRFAPNVKFVCMENRTVPLRRLPKVIPYKSWPTRGGAPSEPNQRHLPSITADRSAIVGTKFLGDASKALPINGRFGTKAVIHSTVSTTERQLQKLRKQRRHIRWHETLEHRNAMQSYVSTSKFSVHGRHMFRTTDVANPQSSVPLVPRVTTEKRTFAGGMILQLLTREPTDLAVSGSRVLTRSVNSQFITALKPNRNRSIVNVHERLPDVYRVPTNMTPVSRSAVKNAGNRTGANAFMHVVSPRSMANSQRLM